MNPFTSTETATSELSSCGPLNGHEPVWMVALTSPEGNTGITVRKCRSCADAILGSVAVQSLGRTVHLRRIV